MDQPHDGSMGYLDCLRHAGRPGRKENVSRLIREDRLRRGDRRGAIGFLLKILHRDELHLRR